MVKSRDIICILYYISVENSLVALKRLLVLEVFLFSF